MGFETNFATICVTFSFGILGWVLLVLWFTGRKIKLLEFFESMLDLRSRRTHGVSQNSAKLLLRTHNQIFAAIKHYKYYLLTLGILSLFCAFVHFALPSNLSINLISEAVFFVLAIIVLNRLIESQRLQKSQQSIKYVREKVLGVCSDLILELRPPNDLQEKFSAGYDWTGFCENVVKAKNEALNKLQTILDRHSYLLESKLRNDIFRLVSSLETGIAWVEYDGHKRQGRWSGAIDNHASYMTFDDIVERITMFVFQANKLITQNALMEGEIRIVMWKTGEAPVIRRDKQTESYIQRRYSFYEKCLKEVIDFRDNWKGYLTRARRENGRT